MAPPTTMAVCLPLAVVAPGVVRIAVPRAKDPVTVSERRPQFAFGLTTNADRGNDVTELCAHIAAELREASTGVEFASDLASGECTEEQR